MKSFITTTTIVLIGFAGVMLFGAFLMVHSSDAESHANCLPTFMGTSECQSVNPLEYVRVHLGALEGLTNAIPAVGVLATFAIVVLSLFAGAAFPRAPLLAPQRYNFYLKDPGSRLVRRKFLKWFAIHEKRDPLLAFAAST